MFNSFWISAFPEVFEDAIVIDSILYIPVDTAIGTMATIVVIYGTLFGLAFWVAQRLANLLILMFSVLRDLILKRKQSASS